MNKSEEKIVNEVASEVKVILAKEASGHDWWHIYRVWKNSIKIGSLEKANMFIVQLAALLHDIADWKFHKGNIDIGPEKAGEILKNHGVEQEIIDKVKKIIKYLSFKGANVTVQKFNFIEGKIVQDADRLDAIGAIGIARVFAYGGYKGRNIYNPEIKPVMHKSSESYIKNTSPSINHFYEKLLLLKNLMNTKTGKEIAERRHEFMENYLDCFYKEWNQEL